MRLQRGHKTRVLRNEVLLWDEKIDDITGENYLSSCSEYWILVEKYEIGHKNMN